MFCARLHHARRSQISVSPRTFQKNRVLNHTIRTQKIFDAASREIRTAHTRNRSRCTIRHGSPRCFFYIRKTRRRVSAPHLRFYSLPHLTRSRINRRELYHSNMDRATENLLHAATHINILFGDAYRARVCYAFRKGNILTYANAHFTLDTKTAHRNHDGRCKWNRPGDSCARTRASGV